MNWIKKNLGIIILIVTALFFAYAVTSPFKDESQELTISQLLDHIQKDEVASLEVKGDKINIELREESLEGSEEEATTSRYAYRDPQTDLLSYFANQDIDLLQKDIELKYQSQSEGRIWWEILAALLPIIIIIGFILFMMRQASGGSGGGLFSFGRSRAKLFNAEGIEDDKEEEVVEEEVVDKNGKKVKKKVRKKRKGRTKFDDVAALEEAKEELKEIVEFLKKPKKFLDIGARIPKGVLLIGSPGTGKTLLARAVAGEAGVPFFSISGSEFVEMFVGVGASRVRDLFVQAKKHAPCIIFIDEIDAVGRQRGAGLGGGHDEREQTLNQILVEMDGFDARTNIIIMAATNRPDVLDSALLRPGRFDRQVVLDRLDIEGRQAILAIHARGKPLEDDVDLEVIAKQTPGFSGADLENVVNEAAILAARANKKKVANHHFQEAIERVSMGPQKKSRKMTKEDMELTAYHEAGHAIVARVLPNADPVHKVTIIPRGMAGGFTSFLPPDNRYYRRRSQFMDELAVILGGYAAEMIVYKEVSTGPSHDLKRASELVRNMVTQYGMSEKMGPQIFGQKKEEIFLGREMGMHRDFSEERAEQIDQEVDVIIKSAYKKAFDTLKKHEDKLHEVAKELVVKETLDAVEFEVFFTKEKGTNSESLERSDQ